MDEEDRTYEAIPDINSFMAQQQSAELSKWELNPEDLIEKIKHTLAGEVFDPETKKWEEKGKRLMNDEGIRTIVTFLSAIIDKNTILSNYEKERVFEMCLFLSNTITNKIYINYKNFGIELSDLDLIIEIVMTPIESAFRRAMEQGERDYRKTWQRIIETVRGKGEQGTLQKIGSSIGVSG